MLLSEVIGFVRSGKGGTARGIGVVAAQRKSLEPGAARGQTIGTHRRAGTSDQHLPLPDFAPDFGG